MSKDNYNCNNEKCKNIANPNFNGLCCRCYEKKYGAIFKEEKK